MFLFYFFMESDWIGILWWWKLFSKKFWKFFMEHSIKRNIDRNAKKIAKLKLFALTPFMSSCQKLQKKREKLFIETFPHSRSFDLQLWWVVKLKWFCGEAICEKTFMSEIIWENSWNASRSTYLPHTFLQYCRFDEETLWILAIFANILREKLMEKCF